MANIVAKFWDWIKHNNKQLGVVIAFFILLLTMLTIFLNSRDKILDDTTKTQMSKIILIQEINEEVKLLLDEASDEVGRGDEEKQAYNKVEKALDKQEKAIEEIINELKISKLRNVPNLLEQFENLERKVEKLDLQHGKYKDYYDHVLKLIEENEFNQGYIRDGDKKLQFEKDQADSFINNAKPLLLEGTTKEFKLKSLIQEKDSFDCKDEPLDCSEIEGYSGVGKPYYIYFHVNVSENDEFY